jgi:hypothetical protein
MTEAICRDRTMAELRDCRGRDENAAVVSYGIPNTYRHPNEAQIDAHRSAGWPLRRTATHGSPGNQGQRLDPPKDSFGSLFWLATQ